MPSTLPTLTWQMTNLRQPVTANDVQSVLDCIALCVGDSTTWEVKDSAAGYLTLGCVAGSNTPNLRIVVVGGINNSGGTPWSGSIASPQTYRQGVIFFGIAPDDGVDQNPFTSASPCSSARFSGYLQMTGDIDGTAPVNNAFVLTADEVICICTQEAAPDDWWAGIGGAIIDPPTDADGEGTPGRVYGLASPGWDGNITSSFWNSATEFLSSANNQGQPVTGCFQPSAPTTWRRTDRFATTITAAPRLTTIGGTQVSLPVAAFFEGAPTNYVGVFRQMRYATDARMRNIVQQQGTPNVDKSYYVGGSTNTDGDVVSFDNG